MERACEHRSNVYGCPDSPPAYWPRNNFCNNLKDQVELTKSHGDFMLSMVKKTPGRGPMVEVNRASIVNFVENIHHLCRLTLDIESVGPSKQPDLANQPITPCSSDTKSIKGLKDDLENRLGTIETVEAFLTARIAQFKSSRIDVHPATVQSSHSATMLKPMASATQQDSTSALTSTSQPASGNSNSPSASQPVNGPCSDTSVPLPIETFIPAMESNPQAPQTNATPGAHSPVPHSSGNRMFEKTTTSAKQNLTSSTYNGEPGSQSARTPIYHLGSRLDTSRVAFDSSSDDDSDSEVSTDDTELEVSPKKDAHSTLSPQMRILKSPWPVPLLLSGKKLGNSRKTKRDVSDSDDAQD
ncbi:MAG: hypothetical protein L6R38_006853 [Xanthoria sp. 2 TBL-2021]|nr:MAG: hypothetical protein L6R38_006853 [Xanthoria sp. 2 TBL-2021]